MIKAQRIMSITNSNSTLNSTVIAERVGCRSAYVRTVWHRNAIFKSEHDPNVSYETRISVRLPIEEYRDLCSKAGIEAKY